MDLFIPAECSGVLGSNPGADRLKDRGCGLAGAGRSPMRKPGRNWAPGPGLGDVGEPRDMGSEPPLGPLRDTCE